MHIILSLHFILFELEAMDASMKETVEAVMSRSAHQITITAGNHYSSPEGSPSSNNTPTMGTPPGMKVASIKARPSSKRMTALEMEDMMLNQSGSLPSSTPTSPTSNSPKVYASVSEMKKAKVGFK